MKYEAVGNKYKLDIQFRKKTSLQQIFFAIFILHFPTSNSSREYEGLASRR